MYVHAHAPTPTTAATPKAPSGTPTASGIHASLINLSAGRKILILEERAYYLAKGHCLYCAGIGHVAHNYLNAHYCLHLLCLTKGTLIPHNHDAVTGVTIAAVVGTGIYFVVLGPRLLIVAY